LTPPATALESLLRSERVAAAVVLIALPLACWAWIVTMGLDMYGPMTGASRWSMTTNWDTPHLVLLWLMWAVMMTAMMLPGATPMILFYGAAVRRQQDAAAPGGIYALAAGYVAVWAVFSVLATVLQRLLAERLLVSPMMELTTPRAGAILLAVAGVYQFTPLKQACLGMCQSPLAFLLGRWRAGTAGALRMGIEHGLFCVGCCWALMLLLFAGGVMNLAVIGALTLFVAFEKLGFLGRHSARINGAFLIALGLWIAAR
jgi:predicted metal-binding membrane protein